MLLCSIPTHSLFWCCLILFRLQSETEPKWYRFISIFIKFNPLDLFLFDAFLILHFTKLRPLVEIFFYYSVSPFWQAELLQQMALKIPRDNCKKAKHEQAGRNICKGKEKLKKNECSPFFSLLEWDFKSPGKTCFRSRLGIIQESARNN